jgi:hypothetical protein
LNDLKKQISSYFQQLGSGRIYENSGTTPLKLLMVVGGQHRKVIQNKNKILLSPPPN